eukprot:17490-Eustigmatos_ZCMA.PRE.1
MFERRTAHDTHYAQSRPGPGHAPVEPGLVRRSGASPGPPYSASARPAAAAPSPSPHPPPVLGPPWQGPGKCALWIDARDTENVHSPLR